MFNFIQHSSLGMSATQSRKRLQYFLQNIWTLFPHSSFSKRRIPGTSTVGQLYKINQDSTSLKAQYPSILIIALWYSTLNTQLWTLKFKQSTLNIQCLTPNTQHPTLNAQHSTQHSTYSILIITRYQHHSTLNT